MLPVKPVYETIGKIGPARLRHRVVPAGMKRVALEESPDGEPGAAEDAVPGDRLDCVLRTGGDEPTAVREKRRNESSVEADRGDRELAEHASILAFPPPLDNWQSSCYTAS